MDSQYSSEWTSLTASLGRTLQAVGLFRVGDDLRVEAARAGGVKDTDGFVVAAEQARAVAVECHTVGRRHLVHSVVGPVGCAQLAADRIPQVQRVRLPNHALSAGDGTGALPDNGSLSWPWIWLWIWLWQPIHALACTIRTSCLTD